MSFKVCDAIMGSGKSSAAITYMNEHPDQKFIYITPYVDEAYRIQENCPKLDFFVPRKQKGKNWSVTAQTMQGLERRQNIASTHSAFTFYTEEMLQIIRDEQYILIVDESINTLRKVTVSSGDLSLLIDCNVIKETEDGYAIGGKEYTGDKYFEFYRTLQSQNVVKISGTKEQSVLYWEIPIQALLAFKDVYILTYQFEGSTLCFYLQMSNVQWNKIGITRSDSGEYRFDQNGTYVPEFVSRLPELINILDNERMNRIGKERTALSDGWMSTQPGKKVKRGKVAPDYDVVRKNVHNYYKHLCVVPAEQRMWTTFKDHRQKLDGNGLATSFVPLNMRATNQYRHKTALAYCANLFVDVGCKQYFRKHGATVNEDLYALSTMIQWIWRSAIRDGKPINIYVPSKRMRDLLTAWIETTAKGGAQKCRAAEPVTVACMATSVRHT